MLIINKCSQRSSLQEKFIIDHIDIQNIFGVSQNQAETGNWNIERLESFGLENDKMGEVRCILALVVLFYWKCLQGFPLKGGVSPGIYCLLIVVT